MAIKHGHCVGNKRTPTFNSWRCMLERCQRKKHKWYHLYGGRGILVCDDWQGPNGFATFLEDMGKRPSINHTIDRIESDGHYEKSNCKWSTKKQQANNRRPRDEQVESRADC